MRSYLYVPGDAPEKLSKAVTRGADALIVDLEDAVPPAGRVAARAAVAAWLRDQPAAGGPALWVRVNPGEHGLADAAAVACPALAGVCVAKTQDAAHLHALDETLTRAERAEGLPDGRVRVVPLLETAAAVLTAYDIARAPRVARLQLGEADLRADLGVSLGEDERELLYVRSRVVLVSAAAGIDPPVGPVSTDIRDVERLRASTVALRRLGFVGRACVHPAQLPVVHEVFTPGEKELAQARDVLDRFAAALAAGTGVCVDADGRLIDEAVVRSARRVLTLAQAGEH